MNKNWVIVPDQDFLKDCQQTIMEMIIPRLATNYKEFRVKWPIPGYGYSGGEIYNRHGCLIAIIILDKLDLLIYHSQKNSQFKFPFTSNYKKFTIIDPEVHVDVYNYLSQIIQT